jgi:hypothetical protein
MHALMKASFALPASFLSIASVSQSFALALPDWYSFVVGLVQEEPDWG